MVPRAKMLATKNRSDDERCVKDRLESDATVVDIQVLRFAGASRVPPARLMEVTIRRFKSGLGAAAFAGWLALLSGCTPPGPQALLEGREFLDEGNFVAAVERFTLATSILGTNAQAWNYLGLACHHAGDTRRAVEAYNQALVFDRDLFEAHFNLGCLWLELGRLDSARSEFTSCTLRRASSIESWLKLGMAQYRSGEFLAAEGSFLKARSLDAHQVEALNGLGLVSAQKRRPRDAAQYFQAALQHQHDYRPALLNLATVLHRDLGDAAGAAVKYREYLALAPAAADATLVRGILQALEPKSPIAPGVVGPVTVATTNVAARSAPKLPSPTPLASVPARTNPPPQVARPPETNAPRTAEAIQPSSEPVVRISPPARIDSPPTEVPSANTSYTATSAPSTAEIASAVPSNAPTLGTPEKPSLLSRLNPFRERKPPPATVEVAGASTTPPVQSQSGVLPSFSRYSYRSPTLPAAGSRIEADAALERGRQSEQSGKLAAAVQAYQQAAQADPAYYEAHYRLALAQYTLRDYAAALLAWENSLAVRPDSADARYNFALTLKSAGFPMDAAAELDRILAGNARDVRAHLILGNICAEQLRDKSRARVHYQRILELDPRHPQATAIRYWLVSNPG